MLAVRLCEHNRKAIFEQNNIYDNMPRQRTNAKYDIKTTNIAN
jgi:hypothetical protein